MLFYCKGIFFKGLTVDMLQDAKDALDADGDCAQLAEVLDRFVEVARAVDEIGRVEAVRACSAHAGVLEECEDLVIFQKRRRVLLQHRPPA